MILQKEYLGCDRQKTNKRRMILQMTCLGRDRQKINKRAKFWKWQISVAIVKKITSDE